jgi:MFS transporter, AAHS family, 4-hydroxybenzoate transporter
MDPLSDATAEDHFVLSDEPKVDRQFRVSDLFRGNLRFITPLLWLGYIASSFAIYFAASWGPMVLEELKFLRSTSVLVASTGGLLGAVAGLALMRFTDRFGALLIAGSHFGILSIAGIFYPSAIRASGAGWATSVAKIGAILGPTVGAAVLSSGLPIIRSCALLAVCPAILFACALGIHMVTRSPRRPEGVLDLSPPARNYPSSAAGL